MHSFPNLLALQAKTGLLPHPHPWRMIFDKFPGAITGIPSVHGTPVATNGIHVALCDEQGHIVLGHMQWFEEYKEPKAGPKQKEKPTPTRKLNLFGEELAKEFV